jgi:hypothetical protein
MRRRTLVVTLSLALGAGACGEGLPVNVVNRRPVILSVTVFPSVISPTDSAIVVCNAMDPDADPLVYDWVTDSRLRFKGGLATDRSRYNTYDNAQVVYPDYVKAPVDTPWVECSARDRRGKSASRIVTFIVRQ